MRQRIVDAIFDGLELAASVYDWVRNIRKAGDADPIPLTHKDAERIAEAGRRAGHERR